MAGRTDNFNRADTASTLGTPSDGGSAWLNDGNFQISSNQAKNKSGSVDECWLEDSNTNATVKVTVKTLSFDVGVIGRVSDANNYWLWRGRPGAGYDLYKKSGGGFTLISGGLGTAAVNDVIELGFDSSDNVTAKVNGTTLYGPTADSFNNTATKFGLRIETTELVDDFSVTDAGGGSTADGAGSASGSATVSGVGSSLADAAGSSSGSATVSGVGSSLANAAGSSSGSATVSGVGSSLADAVGSASGVATVTGIAVGIIDAVGSSSGSATVSGTGSSLANAAGSSSGAATVSGVGSSLWSAAGASIGLATAAAVGSSLANAAGSAAGTSTVTARSDNATFSAWWGSGSSRVLTGGVV